MRRRTVNGESKVLAEIGKRIRWIRRIRGLNSLKLGKAAKLSGAQIRKIERGEHCRSAVLVRLARLLRVSPMVFFADDATARVMLDRLPQGRIQGLDVRVKAAALREVPHRRNQAKIRPRR
jgi:transcriptional regulator with XRE-family HTH domain